MSARLKVVIRKIGGGPEYALLSPQKTGRPKDIESFRPSGDRTTISSEAKESQREYAGLSALVSTWSQELKKAQKVQPTRQTQETRRLDKSKSQRSQQASASQMQHNPLGSKGVSKTQAPRPIGAVESTRAARPDARIGLRQIPLAWRRPDTVDLSPESSV